MGTAPAFRIEEATIEDIHAAYLSGAVTARGVVERYLARIAAYDRKGPALWSLISINANALAEADELDAEFRQTGKLVGPMHGIPVLVKDNIDVFGMETTGGTATLKGWKPPTDATIIRKLRDAGAIVLAKTTMSELARGGVDSINSVLPGFARNPYNTAHATGGSSGGTGSALAANFGTIGLGSDTWGSIRNPSNNNAIVGLRPSRAIVSRAGMIGLYSARDASGPMARTVADVAAMLDVIVGVDPDDPATHGTEDKVPPSFKAFLKADGLKGKRLGVLRQAFPEKASDPQVLALIERALRDLAGAGATIVDPLTVPEFKDHPAKPHPKSETRRAMEAYLARTGPGFPKTLNDIVASGKFHPLHETMFLTTAVAPKPEEDPIVAQLERDEILMRDAYLRAMAAANVDCLITPGASHPPKLNGERNTTPTGTCTWIASGLHWPALIVPMGFTYEDLPSGIQFIGRPFSDALLIEIGHAYEQATKHRHPPSTVPPLS
jgi:Asp-tRNA(Asn)/Glu-tRNA(Gln) amidotransferase A subunit family amidase